MLILSSILLLIFSALVMLVLHLIGRSFKYAWLLSFGVTVAAWLLIFITRLQMPLNIRLVTWQPDILFPASPTLLVDEISWSIGLALITLLLASVVTDAGRISDSQKPDWSTWSGGMVITAIALLAIFAGNLLTLILGWVAVDLTELIFWLGQTQSRHESERVTLAFSARLFGVLLIIGAAILSYVTTSSVTFTTINPTINLYVLIAAGIRLGVLPPSAPLPKTIPQQSGRGVLLRLATAAASLVLLVRSAIVGIATNLSPYLLIFAGLAVIYAGLAWLSADDEIEGQPYWLLGMAALALAASSRAQVEASLAWSLATILSGGLIFLSHARHPRLLPLLALGILGLSTLPYTATWQGVRLYTQPFNPLLIIFLLGQVLFLIGYLRHSIREGISISSAERWVWLIYPLGLFLILVVQYGLTWLHLRQNPILLAGPPGWIASWPAVVVLLLALLILFIVRRSPPPTKGIVKPIELPINWLYRFTWSLYYIIRRIFRLFSTLLEGRAGMLWTLLLLVLLASVLAQAS